MTTEPAALEPSTPATSREAPAGGPVEAANRPKKRWERALFQVTWVLFRALGGLFWRVRVEGRANVPADGPFVLAPVHRSNLDTFLMAFVTRRQLRFMAKDSLWRYRWLAWLITSFGGFPVNRATPDRESLRTCEAALARGEQVVIFPEGTRKDGSLVTDLFDGAAFVALRGGVPIVPVGISGSAGALPKGAKFVHPVKIRIAIGPPIVPPPHPGGRGGRRLVHELTAQLQAELQRLLDQAEGR